MNQFLQSGFLDLQLEAHDAHPKKHISFESQGGQWPPHCVIGSWGAVPFPAIDRTRIALTFFKGVEEEHDDGYTAWDNAYLVEFFGMLRTAAQIAHPLMTVVMAPYYFGVATDYCDIKSFLGSFDQGCSDAYFLPDLAAPVSVEGGQIAIETMKSHPGGHVITSYDLNNRFALVIFGGAKENGPAQQMPEVKAMRKRCLELHIPELVEHSDFRRGTVVFIGGVIENSASFADFSRRLRELDCVPILVVDAVMITPEDFGQTFDELADDYIIELNVLDQAMYFMGCKHPFVYAFGKGDMTASVIVYFKKSRQLMVISRLRNPYKGMLAAIGGFLNAGRETLGQCGVREMFEEALRKAKRRFCSDKDMIQLGWSDDPRRDSRALSVVDHWLLWIVPDDLEDEVLAAIEKGDDAAGVHLFSRDDAHGLELAFDHNRFLEAALSKLESLGHH
jgi:ADP-ribose pyrophosphatase YjhB (NUDIX family)/nicotinamidase-related amidase